MRSRLRAVMVMCVAWAGACSSSATKSPGLPATTTTSTSVPVEHRPFTFTVRHETFVDASRPTSKPGSAAYSRARTLPTDIYIPASSTPRPLIMFSHGYHGAPAKFSQLFAAWARAGYMVAAPRFPLTSNRGKPFDEVADYVHQPADITFVLDQLLAGPLRSRIDTARLGVAGLSLGGATTYGVVDNPCCRDTRFRAAAFFDAVHLPFDRPFEQNRIPVLIAHIDTDIAAPYKTAQQAFVDSASPKWLLTFHIGVHPEAYENTPSVHDRTATQTSIDFFDLTLLGDTGARARLMRDGTHPGESKIVAG